MHPYRLVSLLALVGLLVAACAPAATPTPLPPTQPPAPAATAAPESTATTAAPAATATLAKPSSKELNLYGWSDYVPQQMLDDFTTKFGIKVNYDTYSSNEEMLAKLQAGASGYDVIIPSDYTVAIMIKQDMLEPIDVTQLKNFGKLDQRFINRD